MTIEIYSIYPDRGSQGNLRTYKYCVSCIQSWFPYRDDSRSVPIKFPPSAFDIYYSTIACFNRSSSLKTASRASSSSKSCVMMGGFTECAGSCFSTALIFSSNSFNRIFSESISFCIIFLSMLKIVNLLLIKIISATINHLLSYSSTFFLFFYAKPLSNI